MLADEGSEIMAMAGLEKLLDKGLQEMGTNAQKV